MVGKPLEPRPWRAGWNHGGLFLFEFVKYEREIQEAGVVREKGYFDPDPIRVKPRCI